MDKLQLRSDGISETPAGLYAVVMRFTAGTENGNNFFTYKANVMSLAIRLEWPIGTDVLLIPGEVGASVVSLGYARYLTQLEVDGYNAAVDAFINAFDPEKQNSQVGDPASPLTVPPIDAASVSADTGAADGVDPKTPGATKAALAPDSGQEQAPAATDPAPVATPEPPAPPAYVPPKTNRPRG